MPEGENDFHPHLSLAYSHTSGAPLAPIRALLARYRATIPTVLTRALLIGINRDHRAPGSRRRGVVSHHRIPAEVPGPVAGHRSSGHLTMI
ncbi:hypothetical protein AB0G05_17405 [Nonomuraea wenchangensis]